MASEPNGTRISANGTWINLGILIMVVGGAISLTTFLVGYSKDLEAAVELLTSINGRMESVEKAVTALNYSTQGNIKRSEWRLWAAKLQQANTGVIVVPDVEPAEDER